MWLLLWYALYRPFTSSAAKKRSIRTIKSSHVSSLSVSPKIHIHVSVSCSAAWQGNFTTAMSFWVAALLFLFSFPPKMLAFPHSYSTSSNTFDSLLSTCDTVTWVFFLDLFNGWSLPRLHRLQIATSRLGLLCLNTLIIHCFFRFFYFLKEYLNVPTCQIP